MTQHFFFAFIFLTSGLVLLLGKPKKAFKLLGHHPNDFNVSNSIYWFSVFLMTFCGHFTLPISFPLLIAMDMDSNTDIICKLCGAWFETRKGLSSHARAHLRHFGVEYSESKGSPIDLLNTLILTDDFKRRATSFRSDSPEDLRVHGHSVAPPSPATSTPTSTSKRPYLSNSVLLKNTSLKSGVGSKATSASSSSSTHTLLSPPTKKLKPSQQVFRLSGRELMSIPQGDLIHYIMLFCMQIYPKA